MNLACGQEKLLQFSKAVQERMAATLTVSRAPGMSRSSDVSDDSNAAASTPSGGYWPMMRRTVTGRPLAASSLSPDRSAARKRLSGLGCSAAMSTERRAPATRSCTGSTRASEWPKQTLRLARAGRGRPDRAAGAAAGAVGVAAAGRQHDVTFAILAVERIERQIVGAMAPARRALHQPILRQAVAAAQIVGDAGKLSVGIALGDFAPHLLEQRHGRGVRPAS